MAACRNRQAHLRQAASSWSTVHGISEVILVDWGSSPPLAPIVDGSRVRVIRVDSEREWVLSRAYNLGIALAESEWILRVDCDHILKPLFVEKHLGTRFMPGNRTKVAQGEDSKIWCGNWKQARDDNELHLNGALLMRKADFWRVGGYDERIQTYGWDDEDLFGRLEGIGLERKDLDYDMIEHVKHEDRLRGQQGVEFPDVSTEYNQLLLEHLPRWRGRWTRLKAENDSQDEERLAMSRYRLIGRSSKGETKMRTISKPPSATELVGDEARKAAWELALGRRLHDGYGVCWDVMTRMGGLDRALLLSKLRSDGKREGVGRLVMVHVMHGLGNRLRALGSAMAFARATGRVVVVIWEVDRHCGAKFEELFERRLIGGEEVVVVDGIGVKWPLEGAEMYDGMWRKWEVYNYMEREGSLARKDELVRGEVGRNVYFKAAYVMVTEPRGLGGWDGANRELRRLVAVSEVREVVGRLEGRLGGSVGVHIRHLDTGKDIGNVDAGVEYGRVDARVIDYWRKVSSVRTFVKGVREVMEEWRREGRSVGGVFVAGDDERWRVEMERELGGGLVWWLEGVNEELGCSERGGRSAGCLRVALAELLCLARSELVLGSMWSSFSEAVGRLGDVEVRLAGVDFGDVVDAGEGWETEVVKIVEGIRRKRRQRGIRGHKSRKA